MESAKISARVDEIIAATLCVPDEEITPGADLADDLGMDSIDRVELVMVLEEQLLDDSPIDEATADSWRTIQNVRDTIAAMLNEKWAAKKKAGR